MKSIFSIERYHDGALLQLCSVKQVEKKTCSLNLFVENSSQETQQYISVMLLHIINEHGFDTYYFNDTSHSHVFFMKTCGGIVYFYKFDRYLIFLCEDKQLPSVAIDVIPLLDEAIRKNNFEKLLS